MQPPEFGDNFDPEEMEAWLAEVELVHEKIKKLADEKANPPQDDEELIKMRLKRQEQERKKEEAKRLAMQQKEDEERKGRKGKGQGKDYASYCKYCQLEYVRMQDKCYWCKRDTLTLEQRHAQLQKMVEEYKEMKNRKQQKKQKFELMDKTEKILWKKSTLNHKKWDYYTSSEEEIQSDPIVPKDDPNFKALEMDMEQRRKKKEEDMKKAEILRLKGNEYFSKTQYDHAVWKYSEALDLVKDNKSLWLNRAIAYIKLNKNKKAISDCSRVIEFAECFENGYTQSRENCFKAFLRRALAYYNRDRLEEAKKDIEQALLLFPDEKEPIQLKRDIEAKIEHYERLKKLDEENKEKQENQKSEESQITSDNSNQKESQEIKQEQQQEKKLQDLNFKQIIDLFVEGKEIELLYLFKALKGNQNEATAYFYEKKGLEQLIKIINKQDEKLHDQYNIMVSLPALIMQIYQEKSLIYQEQFLIDYKGVEIIMNKIDQLLKQVTEKQTSAVYDTVADYFDVINVLDESKPRELIQKHPLIKTQIYPELFKRIIPLYNKEFDLVATFLSFCSNLCYGQNTPLKIVFFKNINDLLIEFQNLFNKIELKEQNIRLLNQLCNLISNLLTEERIRIYFLSNQMNQDFFVSLIQFLKKIQFKQSNEFIQLKENTVAIFVNLTYQIGNEQIQYVTKINELVITLVEYLNISKSTLLTERLLTVLAKVNYDDNIYLITKYLKQYSSSSLRCLLQWLGQKSSKIIQQLKTNEVYELLEELKQLLNRDEEIIYCNSCNVIGMIIDLLCPIQGEQNACSYFYQMIPRLLGFAKDRVGNYRKNSAILLAKLTKDQKNLQSLRELHGMEILQSIMGKM